MWAHDYWKPVGAKMTLSHLVMAVVMVMMMEVVIGMMMVMVAVMMGMVGLVEW